MSAPSPHHASKSRAFTIVELLVVIAVIALLLALLLASLQAAGRASRQTVELNTLRQIHMGWVAYSSNNNDFVMPGYLGDNIQEQWRVRYKFESQGRLNREMTRTYPWRLLPFIDWNYESMLGYRDDREQLDDIPKSGDDTIVSGPTKELADQPWFGYNAYYVGGWWDLDDTGQGGLRFSNSTWFQSSTNEDGTEGSVEVTGKLVVRSVGRAIAGDQLLIFGTSTARQPGVYTESREFEPGSAWICPPRLGSQQIWGTRISGSGARMPASGGKSIFAPGSMMLGQSSGVRIEVFTAESVPYRRGGPLMSSLFFDGNTQGVGVGELLDMRLWTNAANLGRQIPREFSHGD